MIASRLKLLLGLFCYEPFDREGFSVVGAGH